MKSFILYFFIAIILMPLHGKQLENPVLEDRDRQVLLKILNNVLGQIFALDATIDMLDARNKIVEQSEMPIVQVTKVLDTVDNLIDRNKIPKGKKRIRKLINSVRGNIIHLQDRGCAGCSTGAQSPPAQHDETHIQNRLVAHKNIVFNPKTSGQFMNAVGSFTEGIRVLKGSVDFKHGEAEKKIVFATPFHDRPVVVFSVRFRDVTFATPTMSEVTNKNFSIKGLSLPPPAHNRGSIDYVAIGI